MLTKIMRNKSFLFGTLMVASILFMALFANFIAPYPFDEVDMSQRLQSPSFQHIFGTDRYGRDVFSRMVYGSRIALRTGAIISLIQFSIGIVIGISTGYIGGYWDILWGYLINVLISIPSLILAVGIVAVLGPSLDNVIIALALVSWTGVARVLRAKTQALKNLPFVEAGLSYGESPLSIMRYYIFPNILPTLIVMMTLSIPSAIMSSTGLGFLGLGAQQPSPDWGLIISESLVSITLTPWLLIFPGLVIVYTVLGMNLFGEGLRDLLDPKLVV